MFLYPWGDFHSLNLGWFLQQFKEWVEKIQEYLDNGGGTAENLANVIAPVFNANTGYGAGDYVLYNNELYKSLHAVSPGTWDPNEWEPVIIVDEMGSGGGGAGVDSVARLMIAGQYSASFAYQKYAICRYADKLWMCNTNLPSGGEAWNAAHWDEITVGAGLTGLRRNSDTFAADISRLNTALGKINNFTAAKIRKWDINTNGKIIFMGNSYAKLPSYNYLKWPERTAEYLGLTEENDTHEGDTWWNIGSSGAALSGSADNNYKYLLEQWIIENPSELNNIGAVVLVAGINDSRSNRSGAVMSKLQELAGVIKTNLPRAAMYNGFCGWVNDAAADLPDDHDRTAAERIKVARYYMQASQYGWIYLNGIETVFHSKAYFQDYVHPNENGEKFIGRAVAEALMSGACSDIQTSLTVVPTGYTGADYTTSVDNGRFDEIIYNGIVNTTLNSVEIGFPTATELQATENGKDYIVAEVALKLTNLVDFGNQTLMAKLDDNSRVGMIARVYASPNHGAATTYLHYQIKGFVDGATSHTVKQIKRFVANAITIAVSD